MQFFQLSSYGAGSGPLVGSVRRDDSRRLFGVAAAAVWADITFGVDGSEV